MSKIKDHVREDMLAIVREYIKDNMNEKDVEDEKKLAVLLSHILDSSM